jgi:hypothetical protein
MHNPAGNRYGDSMQRIRSLLALIALAAAWPCLAAEPPKIGLTVASVQESLAPAIEAQVTRALHDAGIEVTDRLPAMEIIVFASQDTNDRRNTEGVSIAFAFTSSVDVQQLAVTYVDRKQTPPERLIDLLRGHGQLLHLNVAHVDEPSDAQLQVVARFIADTFKAKYLSETP